MRKLFLLLALCAAMTAATQVVMAQSLFVADVEVEEPFPIPIPPA